MPDIANFITLLVSPDKTPEHARALAEYFASVPPDDLHRFFQYYSTHGGARLIVAEHMDLRSISEAFFRFLLQGNSSGYDLWHGCKAISKNPRLTPWQWLLAFSALLQFSQEEEKHIVRDRFLDHPARDWTVLPRLLEEYHGKSYLEHMLGTIFVTRPDLFKDSVFETSVRGHVPLSILSDVSRISSWSPEIFDAHLRPFIDRLSDPKEAKELLSELFSSDIPWSQVSKPTLARLFSHLGPEASAYRQQILPILAQSTRPDPTPHNSGVTP